MEVAARRATSSGAVSTARCKDSVAPSTCRRTAINREGSSGTTDAVMTASRASWVAVSAAEAIGCHSCSACRRLRAAANANNSTTMAMTRTIAPMIQPQGVALPDTGWLGALVVVVGASVVVVVGASVVVVVVGPCVVVVVGASVVVVVGASVVVVTSVDVVGGSVVDVGGSAVVGSSAEGVWDPTPVVVLDDGLLARFDP